MTRAQTTPQLQNAITFGSCKVEYRAYGSDGAFTDLGLGTGIEVTENVTPAELKPDNASPLSIDLAEHSATMKMDMWELDFTKIYALRGGSSGLDNYTTQAAEAVTVADEPHTFGSSGIVWLDHKDGDGSAVASVVVKYDTSSTATLNTDYSIVVGADGKTGIARVASSTNIAADEAVLISYSYTPLASKTWSTGGKSTIGFIELKLTNVKSISGVDKSKIITIHKAQVQTGLEMKFPAGDSSDPVAYPLEMKAYDDATRTAGDQLFSVYDEQGV